MATLCSLAFVCVIWIINFNIVSAGQLWTTTEEPDYVNEWMACRLTPQSTDDYSMQTVIYYTLLKYLDEVRETLMSCHDNDAVPPKDQILEVSQHIKPEDLRTFHKTLRHDDTSSSTPRPRPIVPDIVDCFGLGSMMEKLPFIFNMKPDNSDIVKTHFYLSSRKQPKRVQIWPGDQFGLEWVDFNPKRMTVMIVHGFMSHSNASWVTDMANAFLKWGDVNVVVVDWSGGGNTWKYWRAVANTRQVGSDITRFFKQLINVTGANVKDFYFIGHSLGAHICSFASYHLGLVSRITGLDPAQPCFETADPREVLDDSDADYVDVIHTNGRLLHKIGFGHPAPIGHADFYPNGGMKQPGCRLKAQQLLEQYLHIKTSQINQAICSHGRSYLLFTESLLNSKCYFTGHHWNLTLEGVNASLASTCNVKRASCALMGIDAVGGGSMPRARGPYFVLTKEEEPFCPLGIDLRLTRSDLLRDLKEGFQLDIKNKLNKTLQLLQYDLFQTKSTVDDVGTTTNTMARNRWINKILSGSYDKYQATAPDGGDITTDRINKVISRSHDRYARSTKLNDGDTTTDRINKVISRSHDRYARSTKLNDGDTTTDRINKIISRSHDRYTRSTKLNDGDTTTDRINKIISRSHDRYARSTKLNDGDTTTDRINTIISRSHDRYQARSIKLDDSDTTTDRINNDATDRIYKISPKSQDEYQARSTTLDVGDTTTDRINYDGDTNTDRINTIISRSHERYQARSIKLYDSDTTTDRINNYVTDRINKISPKSQDEYQARRTTLNVGDTTTDRMNYDGDTNTDRIKKILSTLDDGENATDRMKKVKEILPRPYDGYQGRTAIMNDIDTTTKKGWFSWFRAIR